MPHNLSYLFDSYLTTRDFVHAFHHHPTLLLTGLLLITLAAICLLARECFNARRYGFYYKKCIQRCQQLPDPLQHSTPADDAGGIGHDLRKQLIQHKNQLCRINTLLRPHPTQGTIKDLQLNIVFPRALRVRRVVSVYERTEIVEQSVSGVTTIQHFNKWVTLPIVVEHLHPTIQTSPTRTLLPRYGGTLSASALSASSLSSVEWTTGTGMAGINTIHVHERQISDECNWWLLRPMTAAELLNVPQYWKQRSLQPSATYLYASATGGSSLHPHIGDYRIQFYEVPSAYCAIVGQLRHDDVYTDAVQHSVDTVSLVPYQRQKSKRSMQIDLTTTERTSLLHHDRHTQKVAKKETLLHCQRPAPNTGDGVSGSLTATRPTEQLFIIDREVGASLHQLIRKRVACIGCSLGDWLLRVLCLVMTLTGAMMLLRSLTHQPDTTLLLTATLLAVQWLVLLECIAWALASSILLVPCIIVTIATICLTYENLMPLVVDDDQ